MVRDKLLSRYDVTLWWNDANFGRERFIFEVNFEQQEQRKHPYFKTLN